MVIPGLTNILSFNTNGATIIANPANWFANYTSLTSFDGTDTNVTGRDRPVRHVPERPRAHHHHGR